MKKILHLKKWVSCTLSIILSIAFFLLLTIEFEDPTKELIFGLICLSVIFINSIILGAYE